MSNEPNEDFLASQDYLATAQKCADQDLNFELENKYLGHAQALFCIALRKSRDSFKIFTGRLPELFLDFIKADLKAAIVRGVKVSIIFSDVSSEANSKIQVLKREFPESLIVLKFKNAFSKPLSHFFVADSKMYRIEEPHKPLSEADCNLRTPVPAVANFNDPTLAKDLDLFFGKVSSKDVAMMV